MSNKSVILVLSEMTKVVKLKLKEMDMKKYYLRYTENLNKDIETGCSFRVTGDKLEGLCAWDLHSFIEDKIKCNEYNEQRDGIDDDQAIQSIDDFLTENAENDEACYGRNMSTLYLVKADEVVWANTNDGVIIDAETIEVVRAF